MKKDAITKERLSTRTPILSLREARKRYMIKT